jgi:hypothetical protein
MKKQAILLVHGMGKHAAPTKEEPGAFTTEFLHATSAVLQKFPAHKNETLEDYFDLHEFNYDQRFDPMRAEMADRTKPMRERMAALGDRHGIAFPADLASRLTAWESDFSKDRFFATHWLDVIFYGSPLGEKVRTDLALQITALMGDYGIGNIHVIAHSLGTGIVHDTLHQLFRPEDDPNDLKPSDHRLGSVWMFANVSRLINSVTRLCDPLASVVKPDSAGCTKAFINVRHKLDPFTWLATFDPQDNGSWVPGNVYSAHYSAIVTDLVREANPHSFTHYLSDPAVWTPLFDFLLEDNFQPSWSEIAQVAKKCADESLDGASALLEGKFKGLTKGEIPPRWDDYLQTAKSLGQAVKQMEKLFPRSEAHAAPPPVHRLPRPPRFLPHRPRDRPSPL